MIDASGRPEEITEESGFVLMENDSGDFDVLDDKPSTPASGSPRVKARSRESAWTTASGRSTFDSTPEPSLMSASKELGRSRGTTPAALAARALGKPVPGTPVPAPVPHTMTPGSAAAPRTAPPLPSVAASSLVSNVGTGSTRPAVPPMPTPSPAPSRPLAAAPTAPRAPVPASRLPARPAAPAAEPDPNFSWKLIGAFASSFLVTTALVLAGWFTFGPETSLRRAPPPEAAPAPPAASAAAAAPAPVPVPVDGALTPPAGSEGEPGAAAVGAPAFVPAAPGVERVPTAPPPPPDPSETAPPIVHSSGNQKDAPGVAVFGAPSGVRSREELIEEPPPAVAPPVPFVSEAPTVERPSVPAVVSGLAGTYSGKAAGRTATLTLEFLGDGKLKGTVKYTDGEAAGAASATGTYSMLADGSASVALVEAAVADPQVYSGVLKDGVYEGMVTAGGKSRGRFRVER